MDVPWWGWVLIWTASVLLLLTMLAVGTWYLFRKGIRLLAELGELADATAVLAVDEPVLPAQQLAVLSELREVRRREHARRAHRHERRRLRRDARLARARRLVSADPVWPDAWRRTP